MPKNEARKLAEGRIYTGRQALDIGLVDRLGGLKDAVAAAREAADIPPSAEIKLVQYPRPSSFGEIFEDMLGLSMMMQSLQDARRPAAFVSFDAQLRHFAQRIQPRGWIAILDVREALRASARSSESGLKLLGAPSRGMDPFSLP